MHPTLCNCGSRLPFSGCCQPLLRGECDASSAEHLMRSRYTAYSLGDFAYVSRTWHASTCPPNLIDALNQENVKTQWLGLNILNSQPGKSTEEAYVTFFARYSDEQSPSWIYETSRFVRENNRWYYIDGIHRIPGRNETCPCGSQKKFKKCCAH